MKTKSIISLSAVAFAVVTATSATAATVGYVANPSTNSTDFAAGVSGISGATLNTNVNFNGMSLGALDGSFYSVSDGVTITTTGAVNGVSNTSIGQANTGGAIPGEGVHDGSRHVNVGSAVSSFTFNFDSLVYGAGLFTHDVFSDGGLRIEAFSGLNGTGTSLGAFASVTSNFQRNGRYFMGLTSDTGFRSFVFSDLANNGGDIFGVDDFQFASGQDVSAIPVPASLPLLLAGFGVLAGLRRRART